MGLDQSARETKRRRNSEQIKQKPDELPGLTGAMLRARTRKKAAEVTQLWRHARRPTKYGERAVKAHGSGKWVDLTSAELQLEWKPFNLRLVYVCKMKQQQLHSVSPWKQTVSHFLTAVVAVCERGCKSKGQPQPKNTLIINLLSPVNHSLPLHTLGPLHWATFPPHTHTGKNVLPMSQRTHNWFDGSHFFSLCGLKSGSLCRYAGKWVIHLHMRHWGRACPPLLPLQHNKRCSALK